MGREAGIQWGEPHAKVAKVAKAQSLQLSSIKGEMAKADPEPRPPRATLDERCQPNQRTEGQGCLPRAFAGKVQGKR